MHQETLDVAESLLQQTWRLRQIAPLPEAERSARHLSNLFDYFLTYLPPPALLEPRFLALHAQIQRLLGVMHVERKQYDEALQCYSKMNQIAEQLGEPYFLTLAQMNIGVELERVGHKKEAVELLEKARDTSFGTSREIASMVHAYLGISEVPGLAEVLAGTSPFDNALLCVRQLPNLYVLPAGESNIHPTELLATIYHAVGINPGTIVYNHLNQPREMVQGQPVPALFA